jgi:hypothetical protein
LEILRQLQCLVFRSRGADLNRQCYLFMIHGKEHVSIMRNLNRNGQASGDVIFLVLLRGVWTHLELRRKLQCYVFGPRDADLYKQ